MLCKPIDVFKKEFYYISLYYLCTPCMICVSNIYHHVNSWFWVHSRKKRIFEYYNGIFNLKHIFNI